MGMHVLWAPFEGQAVKVNGEADALDMIFGRYPEAHFRQVPPDKAPFDRTPPDRCRYAWASDVARQGNQPPIAMILEYD